MPLRPDRSRRSAPVIFARGASPDERVDRSSLSKGKARRTRRRVLDVCLRAAVSRSDAAAPVAAPTVCAPFDILLVTLKRRILWQPHFFRGRIEAFARI